LVGSAIWRKTVFLAQRNHWKEGGEQTKGKMWSGCDRRVGSQEIASGIKVTFKRKNRKGGIANACPGCQKGKYSASLREKV